MECDTSYTVTVRGTDILLTKSQIEYDSPNYFTTCFLGDFKESQTRHIKLSRDPDLFLIISDYLCGYKVLPLNDRVIPKRMSPELALENLRADAEFYQLDNLIKECDKFLLGEILQSGTENRKEYLVLGCEYKYHPPVPIDKQMDIAMGSPISQWRTKVTAEKLTESPFDEMKRPQDFRGFTGLQIVGEIERYARTMMGFEPQLVGWHIDTSPINYGIRSLLMVVVAV
ncbi:hypothetical protein RHS04_08119 [Rhizoctonia solani]|uniref:BTB domain-containing protein n=1 Tax=Rhizoctonia solani TaxID=456999 RepID=A0A8H7H160_9AGAM|nr:hypothetical protein RHS04_08119 [Rhizoctonia solani]